ncbi:UDP-N-acetylmuramate--L-alanine ligase [Flavimarina sp. Hel_I_48]|uniref:UDP-N-acetylmuramate--L-alanine ligase n=1 Tax=Flavimarina sp. Hel_I_48 TaxID=1392488 RepID=UPI000690E152
MSALARYFKAAGHAVYGYDKTPSTITNQLEALGISIHYEDSVEAIPVHTADKESVLVVYTPAIPKNHKGFAYVKNQGFSIKKRAEVLGLLTKDKFCLAVAGTHGKTTTSAILGHLLAETGVPVTAFLGGIATNYNSNLIQKGEEVIVVEADEYDRSFLQLYPNIASISSMDADHLDIYGDVSVMEEGFREFAQHVQKDGTLFIKNGLDLSGITVAVEEKAEFSANNVTIKNGAFHFDLHYPDGILKDIKIQLPGRHNVFNAATALAMAIKYGVAGGELKSALGSFSGVNRRFTYRINREDLVLIDDYAHHPTEIDAVRQSVRELYPNEEVLVVFQPHLFSRTCDFMEDFAKSLSQFDEVLLLDIYPAREEPIEGVNSELLLKKITLPRKRKIAKNELKSAINASKPKIIVMLGAGDIGVEIEKLTKILTA